MSKHSKTAAVGGRRGSEDMTLRDGGSDFHSTGKAAAAKAFFSIDRLQAIQDYVAQHQLDPEQQRVLKQITSNGSRPDEELLEQLADPELRGLLKQHGATPLETTPLETTPLEAALTWARRGVPVFPVGPHKVPLVRRDKDANGHPILGTGGFKKATTDPIQITAWWAEWPDALIGGLTGKDIIGVDLDMKHGKDGFSHVPDWKSLTPAASTTPSGGAHLVFRGDDSVASKEIVSGVEIKGANSSIILPGSPGYPWLHGELADGVELPALPDRLRPPPRAPRQANDEPQAEPCRVAAMLAEIPNDDLSWGEWTRIGMAIWAATDGSDEGLEIFHMWSCKSTKYDGKTTDDRWDGISRSPPNAIGAGTLSYEARQFDPDWERKFDKILEVSRANGTRRAITVSRVFEEMAVANDGPTSQDRPNKEDSTKCIHTSQEAGHIVMVRAADIVPRAKSWLWKGHLLRGALELLTGLPGLGKSQVQCHFIACSTAGLKWPDGTPPIEPINVIMVTAEDALDTEVVPRLVAAGANLERVHILKSVRSTSTNGELRQFLLAEDLVALERAAASIGEVGLITVDPITAYMGGKMDSHKATEVRSQLGPLKDFAEKSNTVVSAITHPSKNASVRRSSEYEGFAN